MASTQATHHLDTAVGRLVLVGVIIFALGATLYAWQTATNYIIRHNYSQFEILARENEKALLYRLESYAQVMLGTAGFFEGSDSVSRREYGEYINALQMHQNFPGIEAIARAYVVETKDLKAFEEKVRTEAPDFVITPTIPVDINYIATLVEPASLDRRGGFNFATEPVRRAAAELARDTNEVTMTQRTVLRHDKTNSPGFILYFPMYKKGMPTDTVEQRRAAIEGWITAGFIGPNFLKNLTNAQGDLLHLRVYDGDAIDESKLIYDSSGGAAFQKSNLHVQKQLLVKQRTWTVVWSSTPKFDHDNSTSEPEIILGGGLVITALLGMFILFIIRRAETVQLLVNERTQQLNEAGVQREKLVDKLTASNEELERFAYVASHDMQEPLRMVSNLTDLLALEYKDKIDDTGRTYIKIIVESAHRMQAMINDLLEYARTGNDMARMTDVDAEKEVRHVLTNLQLVLREGARVTHDGLPIFRGNQIQIMRLLQNLISNGLKYQPPGRPAHVHISAEDKGTHWQFAVRDNGIGISPEHIDQIFVPFKRLHTWDQYKGTGLGLAVCKKIVENHGGEIWATSEIGNGSTFFFTVRKTNGE